MEREFEPDQMVPRFRGFRYILAGLLLFWSLVGYGIWRLKH